jgi:nucleoside-diphosphate-sugar epimerase
VSSDVPTAELLSRFYPNVPVKRPMGTHESLLSNAKLKRLLGWEPKYAWRDQVKLAPAVA